MTEVKQVQILKPGESTGRGQKACTKCWAINGVRQAVCVNCGEPFMKTEPVAVVKEVQFVNPGESGGKGRKVCQKCWAVNGVRQAVCVNCNTSFAEMVKAEPVPVVKEVLQKPVVKAEPVQKPEGTPVTNEVRFVNPGESGGKGRKVCKNCHAVNALRVANCVHCNNPFVINKTAYVSKQEKTAPQPEVKKVKVRSGFEQIVHTPGVGMVATGKLCPVPLNGKDYDTVRKWIEDLQENALEHGKQYSISAFIYMINIFYPRGLPDKQGTNPDYIEVYDLVREIMMQNQEEKEENAENV